MPKTKEVYVRYGIHCLSASPLSGVLPSVDFVFLSEHDSYRWASSAIGRLEGGMCVVCLVECIHCTNYRKENNLTHFYACTSTV